MCVKRVQFYPTQWRCSRRVFAYCMLMLDGCSCSQCSLIANTMFNWIITHFGDACVCVNEEECDSHLRCIQQLELNYKDKEVKKGKHPVYDYIVKLDSLFMYKWKFNHMMQMTSNPVNCSVSQSASEWYHSCLFLLQSISNAVDVDSDPNQATQSTSEHDSIEWRKDVVVVSMECE